MKSKGLQPRLLYPARLSLKKEGEIRSFPEGKMAKIINPHQTNIGRDVKELL